MFKAGFFLIKDVDSGGLNGGAFGVILNFMKESLCEPFFRFLRAGKVRRFVKKIPPFWISAAGGREIHQILKGGASKRPSV